MKKIISILLSSLMLFSSAAVGADYVYLYTDSSVEKVSGGITYEQRNILTDNDWIRVYIAYVDLSNPNTAVKVMTAQGGSSYLSTVKEMASANNSTIAINADFFNFSSGQTNMLGMAYKDGELISTPALDNQASFVLTDENEVIMDYFSFEASVTSPQGYTCPIYQINKIPVETGGVTMLTSAWAQKTWGSEKLLEIVVENDTVKEIRQPGSGSSQMPKDGYTLVTNPEINGFLSNFAVGDKVGIDFRLNPDIENIKEATGGNTLLVDKGKLATFTGIVTGYAQRSAVGVTEDGKTLILAATDGRTSNCKGLTQYGMAELMISLGAYSAINLDGGGSTTLVKKDWSGQQQTMNSVSSLRKVSTAIGIFENNVKGTYAASGELKASRDILLVGDSLNLSAMFYDEYGNPFYPAPTDLRFYDEANQDVTDGIYTPTRAGRHTLYATCGNVTLSTQVEAADDVFAIGIEQGDFNLSASSSADLTVYGYTDSGKRFTINPSLLEWSSDSDKISVQNGKVTAHASAGAVISVKYKNKADCIVINKDLYGSKAPLSTTDSDSLYGISDAKTTVAVSGDIPAAANILNTYFSYKRFDSLKKYVKAYITNNHYDDGAPSNMTEALSYSSKISDSTVFITINSTGGYFPADQLANLVQDARGYEKNVVIITQKSPNELGYDGDVIKSILSDLAKSGKTVFYVSGGAETGVKIENGVRYITAGTVADYHVSSYSTDALYCPYVVFSLNGNDIRYEFKNDIY